MSDTPIEITPAILDWITNYTPHTEYTEILRDTIIQNIDLAVIASILGIEVNNSWKVIDSYKSLRMVNYTDTANIDNYGHLRGTVVDVDKQCIVAPAFLGHTTEIVSDCIPNDTHGYMYKYIEGVILRVIHLDSEILYLTHRKIKTEMSRWGKTSTFQEMYIEMGGPTDLEHNKCRNFLVNHPDLRVGSRDKSPGGVIDLDTQESLTLEEAQKFLVDGYSNFHNTDHRLSSGEAVIVINGSKVTKIMSKSYAWRCSLRGGEPDISKQLDVLLRDSKCINISEEQAFASKYIHFDSKSNVIADRYPRREEKPAVILANYLWSLPESQRYKCKPLNIT